MKTDLPAIAPLRVIKLGQTKHEDISYSLLPWQPGPNGVEHLTELAGRVCYQSFDRPNPETKFTRDYLNRTLFEQGHWSIAEHATVTLYYEGVSRAFTHELIRHRHLSYSQMSQRFVDETGARIVVPPALADDDAAVEALRHSAARAIQDYKQLVDALPDTLTRKQKREAARAVLPNCVETKIVVTGNLRAWREVLERRLQPDADAEMREVMSLTAARLADVSPAIFGRYTR